MKLQKNCPFLKLFHYISVPPDILDYPTSTDMVVTEGSNVTLKCVATGSPTPTITWRREGGEPISLPGGAEGKLNFSYPSVFNFDYD